ncbi:MAG TPA: hypothetical protein VGK10_16035 [Prolixibacteraceae bacterium]|jgi:hypothetical protein
MKITFLNNNLFIKQLLRQKSSVSILVLLLLTNSVLKLSAGNTGLQNSKAIFTSTNSNINQQNTKNSTTIFKQSFVKGGVHKVTDYGLLFEGTGLSDSLKQINTSTIQSLLDSVGKNGGGTIAIPAGVYCITSEAGESCLNIKYDNLTLRGAGMTKTKFLTRSEWDSTKRARAVGIRIHGTNDKSNPRKNITLQDFELDGGAGWTGKYNWNMENDVPDEWDISHKGIVASRDDVVDNITLKNLYIHRYRGEILYSGGMMSGRIIVKGCKMADTNGSCFNLYGAELIVDSTECSGPTRFWVELLARESPFGYPETKTSFTNCVFKNAVGAQGFVICQGDNTKASYTISNNIFSDAPLGVFAFMGGIAGPIMISDNKIINCGGDTIKSSGNIIDFEFGGGTVNPKENHWIKNLTFKNNNIEKSGDFISLKGSWDGIPMVLENIKIHNNVFAGKNPAAPCFTQSVIYGESRSWYDKSINNCQMTNVEISDNIFKDCDMPFQIGKVIGNRPLFSGNKYINTCKPLASNLTFSKNKSIISPMYEEINVHTSESILVVQMDTANYPNNQLVKITGGEVKHKIKFVANASTYQVKKAIVLDGKGELWLRFDSSKGKWIETNKAD